MSAAVLAAVAATQVVAASPFAPDGSVAEGWRVTPQAGASCDTGSFVAAGAFRCARGVELLDPCYADTLRTTIEGRPVVVCFRAPWRAGLVRLRPAAPLQAVQGAAPGAPPWALLLASGRRCLRHTGATRPIRGLRLIYDCEGRWLFGALDTSAPTWRARQAATPGGRGLRRVVVATAWT